VREFSSMQICPLSDHPLRPRWQAPIEDVAGGDLDPRLVLAKANVEMRGG